MSPSQIVPQETRFAAATALADDRREIISEHMLLSRTLYEIRQRVLTELGTSADIEKQNAYRQHRHMTRERLRDVRRHMATTESVNFERNTRQQILAESRDFITGLGLGIPKIRGLHSKYADEALSVLERVIPSGREGSSIDFDSAAVWKTPPYDEARSGSEASIAVSDERGSEFKTERNAVAFKTTGEIRCKSDFEIHDSDDADSAYDWTWGTIGIWFQMPVNGAVQVDVDLQALEVTCRGRLDDDYGDSYGKVSQRGQLRLLTWLPFKDPQTGEPRWQKDASAPESLYNIFHEKFGSATEGWDIPARAPGEVVRRSLFSTSVYQPGTWLFLEVAIENLNWFWVNDYTCDAELTSDWFVRGISAKSTGV